MTDREVMQQALDALEHGGPAFRLQAIAALRARLAEPEPEPVAKVELTGDEIYAAAPPARSPLTDEEINEIAATNLGDYRDGEWHLLFARAIERAHEIGGNDE